MDTATIAPPPVEAPATTPAEHSPSSPFLATLALGALGVVYGDIGTSPLYSLREALHASHAVRPTPDNILGILSLIFWSLTIVVTLKYVLLVLKADHHGEGGILALTALVGHSRAREKRGYALLITLGLFGTALLYGDGMITPAISVLSAVEGLEVATPFFQPYIIPITIVILTALFLIQSRGTESVGRVFGPLTLVWFCTIAVLGIPWIVREPSVLLAVNPWLGLKFFLSNGMPAFVVLGSVFLVVTGGEALYADMGHFGRQPIRLAWFGLVFPALILNYFGQGALLIQNPEAAKNPFFHMVPPSALYFVVFIATIATVIASQALISGAFSLTLQAIQLGYLPRLQVSYTSEHQKGQIYVPSVNWFLMVSCIGLVLGFRSSTGLAAAYGVAVTATMLVTTLLFYKLLVHGWDWPRWRARLVCGFFVTLETAFFAANVLKIPHGGWFPLVVGWMIFTVMTTWKAGRGVVGSILMKRTVPLQDVLDSWDEHPIHRVPRTAVFMYGSRTGTPPAMLANMRHNGVVHEKVVVLAVEITDRPYLFQSQRVRAFDLGHGIYRVVVKFGYLDRYDVPAALRGLRLNGTVLDPSTVTFFLGKETVIPRCLQESHMSYWRERLFAFMVRNARDATSFFHIPADQVVEFGTQLEI